MKSGCGIAASMRSLSRYGLTSPRKLVDEDRDQDDRDLRPVRP